MGKEERSEADIRREIAEVELETSKLNLAAAKKSNTEFIENEKRRRVANRQRMQELKQGRENHEAVVNECRHKSGGSPRNILKGGGVGSFSLITRALLPDGVSILLQCSRCRMKEYPPSKQLKKDDPDLYVKQLARYNKFLEESLDRGIENNELRGPTFLFQKDGVPFVPERL